MWPNYFYPRSPCGERRNRIRQPIASSAISIHALLAESDNSAYGALDGASISIHALLAESDPPRVIREPTAARFLSTLSLRRATENTNNSSNANLHFYPRSPCGERHMIHLLLCNAKSNFYPRSPCGERRHHNLNLPSSPMISIHALLAESDGAS